MPSTCVCVGPWVGLVPSGVSPSSVQPLRAHTLRLPCAVLQGANQAAAAARLGHNTFLVAQVGTDTNAAMLRGALGSAGVDTSLITSAEGPSGTAVILLQPSGENSIILVGGANTSDEWQITDAATAAIQSAGAVLLQREIPDVVNVIFAKIARSAGVPVILDAGGADGPLGHDLLTNLTLLSPNETELARLTGLPTANDAQVKAAAEALVASGVNRVLVKLGAQGSMLVDIYGKVVRQRAARALHIVDTTGAGDCFTAAYVVAALRGLSDEEAMRFASEHTCAGRRRRVEGGLLVVGGVGGRKRQRRA